MTTPGGPGPRPPAVLLLHGQPGSARDWDGVVAALGSRARSIAIDRPGWGRAHGATDLEGNLEATLAALDARGVQRAIVVGHSLGGAVAAWLAATHPERVSALVLASPAANAASLHRLDQLLAAPVAGDLMSAAALSGAGLALSTPIVRRRIAHGLGIDIAYLDSAARELLSPRAWRSFVREQRALVRGLPALETRLADIRAPTTVVSGSADRIVPLAAARRLTAQIPDAELLVLDGAGHLLPQRHAGQLAEAIIRSG